MDITIIGNIISNFSLVALVVIFHYVVKEKVRSAGGKTRKALLGLGFAVAAVFSILMGIPVADGVIFDTKMMLAVLAGFYGGWLPGLILAGGAIGARLFIGGIGAFGGSLGVLLSVGAGLLLRSRRGAHYSRCRVPLLLTLGLAAALIQILMVFTLLLYVDTNQMLVAMSGITAPTLALYPVLTVLIGLMFGFVDDRARAHEQLRETQAELEEINATLAERVAERTAELVNSQKMASLGRLMAGIAHELNSPLGAVAGANRILRETLAIRVPEMVEMCRKLPEPESNALLGLLQRALQAPPLEEGLRTRRERREAAAATAQALEERHQWAAEVVGEYQLLGCSEELRVVLDSRHSQEILDTITAFGTAMRAAVIVSLGTDKASRTIQALHNYAHSNHSTEAESLSLTHEINLVLELLHSGNHRGIEVIKNYTDDIYIHGMRDPLNQVWMNLIKNALHAMQYRGTLTLTVEGSRTPGVVCVTVGDTGPGIPEHVQPQLFEPFFSTKEHGEGIGIGLDICKQIIESHDGSIEYETGVNGTTFSVFLPATRAETVCATEPAAGTAPSAGTEHTPEEQRLERISVQDDGEDRK
ncbi:MAG: hypothetical protein EA428_11540 [Spirochaetaceae bacterium]|nr:MAG: hypothetical protein EA428_11540 [Spirochaetaceae bacterium]